MLLGQWLKSHKIFKRLVKALIRLRVCAGWSEPLLVALTTLLEIPCRGSYVNGILGQGGGGGGRNGQKLFVLSHAVI